MSDKIGTYRSRLEGKPAEEVVRWALREFGAEKVVLASSLSIEDQVLTDLFLRADKNARILTLDTGRMFQETYDVMDATSSRYGFKYEVYFPGQEDIEELVSGKGPNSFYESVESRKLCCRLRKVKPLTRALATAGAWVCGLRKEQSVTRTGIAVIEWDANFSIPKINPLVDWTTGDVWKYIKENNLPYNRLYDRGFTSIGCAPCTRAVKEGEDERAGRWWWENPEHKECGLHRGAPRPSV